MSDPNESLESLFSSSAEGDNGETIHYIKNIYESCDTEKKDEVLVSTLVKFIEPFMPNDLLDLLALKKILDPKNADPFISRSVFCKEMLEWTKTLRNSDDNSFDMSPRNGPLLESTPRKSLGARKKLHNNEDTNLNISFIPNASIKDKTDITFNRTAMEDFVKQLQYNNKLCGDEVELLKSQLLSQEEQNLLLQSEIEGIKRALSHEREVNENLIKQSKSIEDVQDNTANLQMKLQQQQKKMSTLEKDNLQLKEQNLKKDNEIQQYSKKITNMHDKLSCKSKLLAELESDVNVKQTQISSLEANTEELAEKLRSQQELVENYEEKIEYLTKEREKSKKVIREQIRKQAQIAVATSSESFIASENNNTYTSPTTVVPPTTPFPTTSTHSTPIQFTSPIKTTKFQFFNVDSPIAKKRQPIVSPLVLNNPNVEIISSNNTYSVVKTPTSALMSPKNVFSFDYSENSNSSVKLSLVTVNGSSSEDDHNLYDSVYLSQCTTMYESLKDELAATNQSTAPNLLLIDELESKDKENKEIIENLREELEIRNKELEIKKQELNIKKQEHNDLESLKVARNENIQQISSLQGDLLAKMEIINQLRDNIGNLEQELRNLNGLFDSIKCKNGEFEEKCQILQRTNIDLVETLKLSQDNYLELESKLKTSQEEIDSTLIENVSLKENQKILRELQEENRATEQVLDCFDKNESLLQRVTHLMENNLKYSELLLENDEMARKQKDLMEEIHDLKEKTQSHQRQSHSRISRKLETANERCNNLETLVERANKENRSLQEHNALLQSDQATLKMQLLDLGEKVPNNSELPNVAKKLQTTLLQFSKRWVTYLGNVDTVPSIAQICTKLRTVCENEDEGIENVPSVNQIILNTISVLEDLTIVDFIAATETIHLKKFRMGALWQDARPASPDSPNLEICNADPFSSMGGEGDVMVEKISDIASEDDAPFRDAIENLNSLYSRESLDAYLLKNRVDSAIVNIEDQCTQIILENTINCSNIRQRMEEKLDNIQNVITEIIKFLLSVNQKSPWKENQSLLITTRQLWTLCRLVQQLGAMDEEWHTGTSINFLGLYIKCLEERNERLIVKSCKCINLTRHQTHHEILPSSANEKETLQTAHLPKRRTFRTAILALVVSLTAFLLLFYILTNLLYDPESSFGIGGGACTRSRLADTLYRNSYPAVRSPPTI